MRSGGAGGWCRCSWRSRHHPLGLLLRRPARARALDRLPQPDPQRRLRPPGELPPLLRPQLSALLPFRPSPPHQDRGARSGAPGSKAVDVLGLSQVRGRSGPLDRAHPQHRGARLRPCARALPQGEGAAHRDPRGAALPAGLRGRRRALGLLRELGGAHLRLGADGADDGFLSPLYRRRAPRPAQRAGRDREHAHDPRRASSCAG